MEMSGYELRELQTTDFILSAFADIEMALLIHGQTDGGIHDSLGPEQTVSVF